MAYLLILLSGGGVLPLPLSLKVFQYTKQKLNNNNNKNLIQKPSSQTGQSCKILQKLNYRLEQS